MDFMFAGGEWDEGERFSFEDSDRFEEDSLCSWISEPESLCNNWRGWKRQNGNQGALSAQEGPVVPLVELSARQVAQHIPFEVVERVYPPVPEQLQLRIAFWSFPENEEDIRLYSCLANGSADEFQKGEHLLKARAVKEALQIGFHLSATVVPPQGLPQPKGSFNVAVVFDRRRITACSCTCNSTAKWCAHVVSLCLFRIHNAGAVCLRAPVSESLSRLHRDQLQKFAQYLISELPQQILPTAQRLLDELLSSQETAINTVCGAPDPTAGPSANDLPTWFLDEQTLHENIKKMLIRFCGPAPIVFSDVNSLYLSTTAPPAAAEWSNLLRPLRGREPEGMWNLLSIVREMFRRRDSNAIPLLEILTEECIGCDQIVIWWFNTRTTEAHGSTHSNRATSNNSSANISQHGAAGLCDELVVLWRLAVLNPALKAFDRWEMEHQLKQWHVFVVDKARKSRGGNNAITPFDIEVFPGFKPAIEACQVGWEDFPLENVPHLDVTLRDREKRSAGIPNEDMGVFVSMSAQLAECAFRQQGGAGAQAGSMDATVSGQKDSHRAQENERRQERRVSADEAVDEGVPTLDTSFSELQDGDDSLDLEESDLPPQDESSASKSGTTEAEEVGVAMATVKSQVSISGADVAGTEAGPALAPSHSEAVDSSSDFDHVPSSSGVNRTPHLPPADSSCVSDETDSSSDLQPADSARTSKSKLQAKLTKSPDKSPQRTVRRKPKQKPLKSDSDLSNNASSSPSDEVDSDWMNDSSSHGNHVIGSAREQGIGPDEYQMYYYDTSALTPRKPKPPKEQGDNYFAGLKFIDDPLEILYCQAEALHAHGYTREACQLAKELAMQMLASPPIPSGHSTCRSRHCPSGMTCTFASTTLAKAAFLCSVLLEQADCHTLAFQVGLFGLEMPRLPACSKTLEVKLANQESELVGLLKKIPLGPVEMDMVRERAENLRSGKSHHRGEAVLPLMLASFIFDALCLPNNCNGSSRPNIQVKDRQPTDELMGFEAAVTALGLKANVSEAEHALLCEGTRRQRGELALAMLLHYKDDQTKLRKILNKLLDKNSNQQCKTASCYPSGVANQSPAHRSGSQSGSRSPSQSGSRPPSQPGAGSRPSSQPGSRPASQSAPMESEIPKKKEVTSASPKPVPAGAESQQAPTGEQRTASPKQPGVGTGQTNGVQGGTAEPLEGTTAAAVGPAATPPSGAFRTAALPGRETGTPETAELSDTSPTLGHPPLGGWGKHASPGSDSGSTSGKSSDSVASSSSGDRGVGARPKMPPIEMYVLPSIAIRRGKKGRHETAVPTIPNHPSEASAHYMFELAKTVLTKAGGNSSTSLFTQPSASSGQQGPHRALHMCAFEIGLYALGLHNCVSPNWLSRTYSSHVSWITGQAMEIGSAAISLLVEQWEGHLTPPEVASLADRASRARDHNMVQAAAQLALSVLPHAHALNPNEIQRALVQCKEMNFEMLEKGCLAVERAAKGGGVPAEVLFEVARQWFWLYEKSLNTGANRNNPQNPNVEQATSDPETSRTPPDVPPPTVEIIPYSCTHRPSQRRCRPPRAPPLPPFPTLPLPPNHIHPYPQIYEYIPHAVPPPCATSSPINPTSLTPQPHPIPQTQIYDPAHPMPPHPGYYQYTFPRFPMVTYSTGTMAPTSINTMPATTRPSYRTTPYPSPPNAQGTYYLHSAYRVGMLAMEMLARRAHDDRPNTKFARNPPYGDSVKWLLGLAMKLGQTYLQQFCVSAVNGIFNPFVLQDIAIEAAHFMSRTNHSQVANNLRSPILSPIVQKCLQMYRQCLHQKLFHITPTDYDEFVGIVRTARGAFCMTPGGMVQFNELLQSLRRSKSCKRELWQRIVAGLAAGNM
ncbi:PREDICTED: zinc finger SWIM domain-containing protein 8-like [Branchiostoma belcheri]|uniref:Zinc finger SWIM domain-containing protein 8-like n=1 Tax=Branchiostoma belcheri TaxID=7741 RepID=A0A6P4ZDN7_BRABE|nr:PREDICTED: zinc finger SWIM domain-containing protein 8-like [Branchiostoma belcheri]